MIKYIIIFLSLMILLFSISFAANNIVVNNQPKQEQKYGLEDDPCKSTSGLGQQECAKRKLDIADKKLNSIYKALLAKLPEVDGRGETERYPKKGLIGAQRKWINYRDANCEFFGDIYGGAPVWRYAENLNCCVAMTEVRTKELQKYFDFYK